MGSCSESSDPSDYSKKDFNTLKNTLQPCIPFIRFYNFTSREFLNKVVPYKKILSKELFKELFTHFLDLDAKPSDVSKLIEIKSVPQMTEEINIDSKIITNKHIELISKWINGIDPKNKLKTPYEFKLLYRGTRDGFTVNKFHEICDNQSHTVSIVKVKNSNEILGGYNPMVWRRSDSKFGSYTNTKKSFIFSFKENIESYILSRVKNNEYAIYNGSRSYGAFGKGDFSLGFGYSSNCQKNSYEKAIRETNDRFSIEEYEVFQMNI